ncbi:hypothetical protein KY389_11335 [Paracoccus bogoriensis]|nr:hypothetical protein [Paracoccus bogoriensis]
MRGGQQKLHHSPIRRRIKTSGGRSHIQPVEGHRDAQGKVCIRVVLNLGRLNRLSPIGRDPLIDGRNRTVVRLANTADEITRSRCEALTTPSPARVLKRAWF